MRVFVLGLRTGQDLNALDFFCAVMRTLGVASHADVVINLRMSAWEATPGGAWKELVNRGIYMRLLGV